MVYGKRQSQHWSLHYIIEAVDGESEDVSEKETADINGFQVSASHVSYKNLLFV